MQFASASDLSMSAFDEHQAWLKRMHEEHARHMSKATAAHASPLPSAPMMWGRPDEANDLPSGFAAFDGDFLDTTRAFDDRFAGIALADDEFEAPVYRSLGGFLGDDAGGIDLAVESESPRYRSLSSMAPTHSRRRDEAPLSAEEADASWLASMPPLIRRQNALRPSMFNIP